MEYHDKVLKCSECGAEFVFTAGEQMFFVDKGFKNEPKRCKVCKSNRVQGADAGLGQSPAGGNQDGLFAVRQGNHCPFQTDPGQARLLPRMLPAAPGGRAGERDGVEIRAITPRRRQKRDAFPACSRTPNSEGGVAAAVLSPQIRPAHPPGPPRIPTVRSAVISARPPGFSRFSFEVFFIARHAAKIIPWVG